MNDGTKKIKIKIDLTGLKNFNPPPPKKKHYGRQPLSKSLQLYQA